MSQYIDGAPMKQHGTPSWPGFANSMRLPDTCRAQGLPHR
jgi:hypothetical protein